MYVRTKLMAIMNNLPLSFKQKLLLGITLSLFVVFGIGGTIAYWLTQERMQAQAREQMDVTSQGIQTMVRSLVISSVKNYLKGISESNIAYIEHVYARFKAGEINEKQAKALAETYMLQQKIGHSGYVTVVDISGDGIKLAVHPFAKGRDLSQIPFAQQMARQKTGYLEFEWNHPGDPKPRLKAEWMNFFAPWQWIVSAAPFRDEFPQLIDLTGIEAELTKVKMQGHGYIFIMDTQGKLLSHPTWKGRNMIDATDVDSGKFFVRDLINSITQDEKEHQAGTINYRIKDPASNHLYSRMMSYRYIPETNWIVGVVTDLDKLNASLAIIRNTQIAVMVGSILMALLVILWVVRPMTRSLGILSKAVEAIDGGKLDHPLPSLGNDEVGHLATSFSRMAERLARYTDDLEHRVAERTTELEEANQKLAALSNTDGLTNLANRRRFDEALASEFARSRRTGQPLALAILDVDYFKKYNDRYGHQMGDECLKVVASLLGAKARRSGDLAARYGGEEFAIILANTELSTAQSIVESVRQSIEATEIPHEMTSLGTLTVSIGLAVMTADTNMSAEALLRAADQALYQAKHEGRNRVGIAR